MASMKRGLPQAGSVTRRSILQTACAGVALDWFGPLPAAFADSGSGAPVAQTQYGKVQGRKLGSVLGYLGIPYGGPAEGARRFLPPVKPEAWTGVRPCIAAGPRAVQNSGSIFASPVIGAYFSGGRTDAVALTNQEDSENCLNLNVLSPALTGKRPVLVYIHGGGFTGGSGALSVISDRLVSEQDVVLVGINHRLNIFGYVYWGGIDPKYADAGNAGQLDLIAALQWVRDNIANFGGDPGNVTIFGESGGGAKISTLLAMPAAHGLFHRAIIQSGALLRASTKEEASENAAKILARLGLSSSQMSELGKLPARQLLASISAAAVGPLGLLPVVDGHSLPRQPWEPDAPPEAKGVSILAGSCKDESTLFVGKDPSLFSLDWPALKTKAVAAGISESAVDGILAAYRKDYPRESPTDLYFRLSGDRGARTNAVALAGAHAAQSPGRVYMYHFDWNTPVAGGKLRAFHSADLPLEMRLVCYPESEDLSRQLSGAWASFARTGNPNHKGIPHWEPYSLAKRATMSFDRNNTRLQYNPAAAEMALLKNYPGGFL